MNVPLRVHLQLQTPQIFSVVSRMDVPRAAPAGGAAPVLEEEEEEEEMERSEPSMLLQSSSRGVPQGHR